MQGGQEEGERNCHISAVIGGKGASADWSCHGNGWHLVYVRVALCMIVFVCGGFCVCECASEHLEVFVSVWVCVCVCVGGGMNGGSCWGIISVVKGK